MTDRPFKHYIFLTQFKYVLVQRMWDRVWYHLHITCGWDKPGIKLTSLGLGIRRSTSQPTDSSKHGMKKAPILPLGEAIDATTNISWLHHIVSQLDPNVKEWDENITVRKWYDKVTGYYIGYQGPKPYMGMKMETLKSKAKKNTLTATGKSASSVRRKRKAKPKASKKSPQNRKSVYIHSTTCSRMHTHSIHIYS